MPHAWAQIFRNRSAFLDRKIGDALIGIELVGTEKSIGGAGVNTARATATTVGSGQIGSKAQRRKDHARNSTSPFSDDDAGILPDPTDAAYFA